MRLSWVDHAADPDAWARALGVSRRAVDLVLQGPFCDLHVDMEVPVRVWGYRPERRHGPHRWPRPFWGHTDYPRLREARLTGVAYDLATNVFRSPASRLAVTVANVARCVRQIEAWPDDQGVARTYADYERITASGRTAYWLCLQGANAVEADPSVLEGPLGDDLHRITLVHLKSSVYGGSNSPGQPDHGLTEAGAAMVALCNRRRILVDLAHAGPRTFWDALSVHDGSLPPVVTHTGLSGVRPLWRNIDDAQARAIADRGGVVGVVYQGNFLAKVPPGFPSRRRDLVAHLVHLVNVAGESAAALGSDYDGIITPPWDLADVTHHPKLVQDLIDLGWTDRRIGGILGANYLRVARTAR
ncbi:MAG: hypothetical protein RLZZ383_730 [Pseudomonadota bacterium]|jgi:membrane dipeptidase